MDQPRIGIVGVGFVGKSLCRLFQAGDVVTLDVWGTDPDQARINACDVAFVCVPTPVH